MVTKSIGEAIEAAEQIDNLLSHVSGINDERDSVPILLGIRDRWPKVRAAIHALTPNKNIKA